MRGNMIHSDEKWEQPAGEKSSARWEVLCGKEEYHKRCWRSAEWKRRVSSLSWGAPKEEGLRSAEWNGGAPEEKGVGVWNEFEQRRKRVGWVVRNEIEESQSRQSGAPMGLRHTYPRRGAPKRGRVSSVECIIGALVGIEELPSWAEKRG